MPRETETELQRISSKDRIVQYKKSVIAKLPISMPARNRLHKVLTHTNLWPTHLHSVDAESNTPVIYSNWSEADTRTGLCIQRTCRELKIGQIASSVFPDRGVKDRSSNMLKNDPQGWDVAKDERLLGLYEAEGDKFERFAERNFNKQFTAYQLALAHAIAYKKTHTPRGNLKKAAFNKKSASTQDAEDEGDGDPEEDDENKLDEE